MRGRTAVAMLVLGFSAQAVGYVLLVSRNKVDTDGWRRVVGGVLVPGLGVIGGWAADRIVQARRLKPSVVRLAGFTIDSEQLALPARGNWPHLAMSSGLRWKANPHKNIWRECFLLSTSARLGPVSGLTPNPLYGAT